MSLDTQVESFGIGRVMTEISLHDALTDSADWNADFWDFDQEKLREFRLRILKEYQSAPDGLIVSAVWVGDPIEQKVELSIEEFVEHLDAGRIGTRTKYLILKEGRTNRCTQ